MLFAEYKELKDSVNTNELLTVLNKIEQDAARIPLDTKSRLVTTMLNDLNTLPEQGRWNEEVTTQALKTMKSLGREIKGSDELFSEHGIQILMKLSGLLTPGSYTDNTQSQEALKCLSNCILLRDNTKEFIVKHDGVAACFHLLESSAALSTESQFLTCRILFFMTVNNSDIVQQLIRLNIQQVLQNILTSNVDKLIAEERQVGIINNRAVTNEALKLLFNLMLVDLRSANDDKDAEEAVGRRFQCCLQPILTILFILPIVYPMPLIPPYTHALHVLMQFPFSLMRECWYANAKLRDLHETTEAGRDIVSTRFCAMLEGALAYLIPSGDPDDLDTSSPSSPAANYNVDATLSPLILNIRIVAAGEPHFVEYFKRHMLPSETDRNQPVNRGKSTSSQLIRLMTSTMLPQTRDAICECLFVLCNEDASQFTQEVGYGNAIGFLVNRGIAVEPPHGMEADDPNKQINPITGQYVSAEEANGPSLAEMTDEEKEREAERLFVLFERLKKNGVISVENPITQAKHSGKFEELDDDDNDKKSSDDNN